MMVRFSFLFVVVALLASTGCQKRPGYVTPVPDGGTPVINDTDGWTFVETIPDSTTTTTSTYSDYNGGDTYGSGYGDTYGSGEVITGSPFNYGTENTDTSLGLQDPSTGSIPEQNSFSGALDESTLSSNTVYFGFDSSTIRNSEFDRLNQVVNFLKTNSSARIKVEGHCDERGTSAYNLALGQRRAASAREYLINAGIDASRISSLSWGEDKPAAFGKTESDYAKNRRAEFVLVR